jgi:hypothetical protein
MTDNKEISYCNMGRAFIVANCQIQHNRSSAVFLSHFSDGTGHALAVSRFTKSSGSTCVYEAKIWTQ